MYRDGRLRGPGAGVRSRAGPDRARPHADSDAPRHPRNSARRAGHEACLDAAACPPRTGTPFPSTRAREAPATFPAARSRRRSTSRFPTNSRASSRAGAPPRFHPLPPPSDDEVARLATRVAKSLARLLTRRGLGPDGDLEFADPLAADEPWLAALAAASTRGRIATGPRAGQRPTRLGDRVDPEDLPAAGVPLCAQVAGVSLHAAVAVPAHDRQPLERLAALVPPPRRHLVRYHGVLAPAAALRPWIVPHPPTADGIPADDFAPTASLSAPGPGPTPPGDRPPGARSPDPGGRYLSWAELLRRVFALDALRCPRCSSRMKILAQIHPPDTTRAILDCLGLASRDPPHAPARAEPDPLPCPGQHRGGLNSSTNGPARAGPDHPEGGSPPPRRPSARPMRARSPRRAAPDHGRPPRPAAPPSCRPAATLSASESAT